MAVDSRMVPIGTAIPHFSLSTADGGSVRTSDLDSRVLVVMFLCNHCPYVQHVEDEIGRLTSDLADEDVAFVGICSNDVMSYPDDAPEHLVEQAQRAGWSFPYAVDDTQSVARAFSAACTPDTFVYGPDRTLVYRGAIDASTPGNDEPVTGEDLRRAIQHTLDGQDVPEPHRPSIGCGIKWIPGTEPE